ncbi:Farnesyl diphosphate synthase [Planctomycetes bacterium Pla163]|uniref:Farnesyl diphosphate synthase n=1 Tax=Rohdeia mirabilis TaxID=2528008 RepID=A0A518D008_9BACT|nr:Farnesyl diphosphate synthase [Planctomycetes bacterium Pla163]
MSANDAAVTGRDAAGWLGSITAWADAQLERFTPPAVTRPERLHTAMRHAVFAGGKRLRPALVAALCEGCGAERAAAERPAAAVELAHTYSLVHDDLPAMDDDALRRGRPTVHVLWGDATAILVGDALQALAFEVLGDLERDGGAAVAILARAIGAAGMVGGQELDLDPALRLPGVEGIVDVHARKTAALFGACAELGALVAGASDQRPTARRFGVELGLAFQAVDDVLDVTGDSASLGKTPGKDAAHERDTLVGRLGLDGARRCADERIEAARSALADLALTDPGPAAAILERVVRRSS